MSSDIGLVFSSIIEEVKRSKNAVVYNTLAEIIQRVDARSVVGDIKYWKNPKRAPKGYRGGQFRGNWQLGVDQKPGTFLFGKIDASGVSTVGENIAKIPERAAYGHKYYLVNNCPYALGIEQGKVSKRVYIPPYAPLALTIQEIPSIIEKICADIKAGGGRTK